MGGKQVKSKEDHFFTAKHAGCLYLVMYIMLEKILILEELILHVIRLSYVFARMPYIGHLAF